LGVVVVAAFANYSFASCGASSHPNESGTTVSQQTIDKIRVYNKDSQYAGRIATIYFSNGTYANIGTSGDEKNMLATLLAAFHNCTTISCNYSPETVNDCSDGNINYLFLTK
jgi:hypothetical protein